MTRKILLLAGVGSALAETAREAFDAIPAVIRAEAEVVKKKPGTPSNGQPDPDPDGHSDPHPATCGDADRQSGGRSREPPVQAVRRFRRARKPTPTKPPMPSHAQTKGSGTSRISRPLTAARSMPPPVESEVLAG